MKISPSRQVLCQWSKTAKWCHLYHRKMIPSSGIIFLPMQLYDHEWVWFVFPMFFYKIDRLWTGLAKKMIPLEQKWSRIVCFVSIEESRCIFCSFCPLEQPNNLLLKLLLFQTFLYVWSHQKPQYDRRNTLYAMIWGWFVCFCAKKPIFT